MLGLDKRMTAIAEAVPSGECVADIGSNHGLIPVYLLERKRCQHVLVTDISDKSLDKARVELAKANLLDRVTFLVCDGLDGVENVDTIIIAGLGGLEIKHILEKYVQKMQTLDCGSQNRNQVGDDPHNAERVLENDPEEIPFSRFGKRATLVLQPMRNVENVRTFLVENEYCLVSDRLVECRGKYYPVLVACFGYDELTELEIRFGRTNLVSFGADFMSFIDKEYTKTARILSGIDSEKRRVCHEEYLKELTYVKIRAEMAASRTEEAEL